VRAAVALAADVNRREVAAGAASSFAAAHQGAAQKTAEAVLALLARGATSPAAR
jgi:3-deoxy-D-manno-octulosonic-acid transferase